MAPTLLLVVVRGGSDIHISGYGNHSFSSKLGGNGSLSSNTTGSVSHASACTSKFSKSDGDHHCGHHLFSHKADTSGSTKGGKRVSGYSGYTQHLQAST